MRHSKAGRQLRRTGEQKLALMRGLAMSLIQHGAIETTEAKAKELRPFVEKLITKARSGTLHDRRIAARHVQQPAIAEKLLAEVGPKFQKRAGGYTRILKLGHRKGDGAEMARIELVEVGPWRSIAAAATCARRASRTATMCNTRTTVRVAPGDRTCRRRVSSSTGRRPGSGCARGASAPVRCSARPALLEWREAVHAGLRE